MVELELRAMTSLTTCSTTRGNATSHAAATSASTIAPIRARRCLRQERQQPAEVWRSGWHLRCRSRWCHSCGVTVPMAVQLATVHPLQSEGGVGDLGMSFVELDEHDPMLGVPVQDRRKLKVDLIPRNLDRLDVEADPPASDG